MNIVTRRQVGVEEYEYTLNTGKKVVSSLYLRGGTKVTLKNGRLYRCISTWSTQTRWVREEEVDEDNCDIIEYGYYDNGDENGWCCIEYEVNRYGKTRKPQ